MKSFSNILSDHMPGVHNKHADALATMASKIDVPDKTIDVQIMKSTLRAMATQFLIVLMCKSGAVP